MYIYMCVPFDRTTGESERLWRKGLNEYQNFTNRIHQGLYTTGTPASGRRSG